MTSQNESMLEDSINTLSTNLCKVSNAEQLSFLQHSLTSLAMLQKGDPELNDMNLIQKAIDELVQSFLIFKDYRDTRKVTIFGSSRTPSSHSNYYLTEETSKKLVESGMLVITGAGPGIMEAGNKGAGDGHSFGLHIILPFEQSPNSYISDSDKMIPYNYFFTRKLIFVKESDAFVLFPGGFGTQDEAFEVLTLMQTGRCSPRPFVVINHGDSTYWDQWKHYVQTQLLDRNYISPDDMHLIKELSSPDEVSQYINHFYSTYHSIRYIDKTACIRLNASLSESTLQDLNNRFSHLLSSGCFELSNNTCFDKEASLYPDKQRLLFKFNHESYGGLISLIEFINNNP
ncbi:TIGR00730 family Rossman fold protein [Candidatus Marinamargulisbacteria bacterium SCGC AG-333-B06]|nr:TIGR00730 family Rossman fold protein [Candidatus Marinamargulisbacteria bacterium SCGC AG-333-B06]